MILCTIVGTIQENPRMIFVGTIPCLGSWMGHLWLQLQLCFQKVVLKPWFFGMYSKSLFMVMQVSCLIKVVELVIRIALVFPWRKFLLNIHFRILLIHTKLFVNIFIEYLMGLSIDQEATNWFIISIEFVDVSLSTTCTPLFENVLFRHFNYSTSMHKESFWLSR
jgi:hypothetical protein